LEQEEAKSFYPTTLLFAFWEPEGLFAWIYILHLSLGGFFAYGLARRLGASEQGALFTNGSFILSGFALGHIYAPSAFFATIWALPALSAVWDLFSPFEVAIAQRRGKPLILAGSVALSWFAGNATITLGVIELSLALGGLLTVFPRTEARPIRLRALGWTFLGLGLGTGIALVHILPSLEGMDKARFIQEVDLSSKDYPMPKAQLIDLVFPGLLTPSQDLIPIGPEDPKLNFASMYLLDQESFQAVTQKKLSLTSSSFAFGLGIWPLLFIFFSLFRLLSRRIPSRVSLLFLWGTAVIGTGAALGWVPRFNLAFWLPPLDKIPAKDFLFFPALSLPLLAGLGYRPLTKAITILTFLLGMTLAGIGLSTLLPGPQSFAQSTSQVLASRFNLFPHQFLDLLAPGESLGNQILLAATGISAGVSLMTGSLFFALERTGFMGVLIATALQVLPQHFKGQAAPPKKAIKLAASIIPPISLPSSKDPTSQPDPRILLIPRPPEKLAQGITAIKTPFFPGNLLSLFGFSQCGGELKDLPLPQWAFSLSLNHPNSSRHLLQNPHTPAHPLVALLAPGLVFSESKLEGFAWQLLAKTKKLFIYRPKTPFPRFRFFQNFQVLSPVDQFFRLKNPKFQPLETLLLESPPSFPPSKDPDSKSIQLLSYQPGKIRLRTQTQKPSLLFVSESWHSGWTLRINNKLGPKPLKADLRFMAIPIQAGNHEIALDFSPGSFYWGSRLSLGFLSAFFLWIILVVQKYLSKAFPIRRSYNQIEVSDNG
jgi:hypothetical protein